MAAAMVGSIDDVNRRICRCVRTRTAQSWLWLKLAEVKSWASFLFMADPEGEGERHGETGLSQQAVTLAVATPT
ncbi:hypothetical protein HaLaN_17670 [Haematococcus lacustris]|uniref:Uncharacterized protein n=1 Tax=Haematococcus lacustris TaxID=44745 RepID=A0A699ZX55_HAELA|nr:hypothetical protein HaLaN_17670 [Haematococcus lacustris]